MYISTRSGLSVTSAGMEQETVKFKLVEDLSLVTIPISTWLLVLRGNKYLLLCKPLFFITSIYLGYILFGSSLFSVWEVSNNDKGKKKIV